MKYLCYTITCEAGKNCLSNFERTLFIMRKQIGAVVIAAMLLFTSSTLFASAGTITASTLNVRENPNGAIIGQLSYGEDVTVISNENGWCCIKYGDGIGYVFGDYVNAAPAETDAASEETVQEEANVSTAGENVLAYAKNFIGTPYRYGGSSPSGFDCSGFVKFVYSYFGISLPRTSYSQMQSGYAVSLSELQVGDLLFFRGGGHVGIYAGNNTYIHAPQSGRTVSIDPINRTVIAARRIF